MTQCEYIQMFVAPFLRSNSSIEVSWSYANPIQYCRRRLCRFTGLEWLRVKLVSIITCVFWYLCRGTGSSKLNLANTCGLDRIRTHDLQITAPNRLAQSLCALPTGPTRLLKKVGLLVQPNRALCVCVMVCVCVSLKKSRCTGTDLFR
jgi:hypothetical protein